MRTVLRIVVVLLVFVPYLGIGLPGSDGTAPVAETPVPLRPAAEEGLRTVPMPGSPPAGREAAPEEPPAPIHRAAPAPRREAALAAAAPRSPASGRPEPRPIVLPRVRPSPHAPRAGLVEAGAGWESVGLVRIGSSGQCTGALVRDDLVLTAAHCLFGEDGRLVPAGSVRFLAGWRDGRALVEAVAADALASPGYDPSDSIEANLPDDVALLRLRHPIRHPRIAPIALGESPRGGDRVTVVSYAADRADAPSLEADCGVLRAVGGSVTMDCLSAPGASGSPILAMSGRRPAVVSVISGGATLGERRVSVAAGLGAQVAELMAAFAAPARPSGREGARTAGGAKFLTP